MDLFLGLDSRDQKSCYYGFQKHVFNSEWWDVYDFLDFILRNIPQKWTEHLGQELNLVLERENSGYRIIGNQICPISSDEEIASIEESLSAPFDSARTHIRKAVQLLSDKKAPDYANAVKEAILAVESAAKEVTGLPKATLGECLKKIEKNGELHPALKGGMSQLYGYSSDSSGIRHALTGNDLPPIFAEAKFMLVVCSAFVNFLAAKKAEHPEI